MPAENRWRVTALAIVDLNPCWNHGPQDEKSRIRPVTTCRTANGIREDLVGRDLVRVCHEVGLDTPPPGEPQLRVDVDDGDACLYGLAQVPIVGSRPAVQGYGHPRLLLDRLDALDVEALLRLPADHAGEEPVHVADGGSEHVDARRLHELPGFGGGAERAHALRRLGQDLRAAPDVADFTLNDD